MKQLVIGAALGLALGMFGSGLAQQNQQMPHGHMMQTQGQHQGHGAAASEAEKAYRAANDKMHKAMAIEYTGDPDKDFVASMIPHHEGAIDMARVQLKYGKDPEIRKLAEAVIREQTREIAEMKAWQAKAK
jgi:uncharacterized protein (DUF305 family)